MSTGSVTPEGPEPDESIRERILRAASMVFARDGYHPTSTASIATAAGVDLNDLFHEFASKAQIMNTLLKADLDHAVLAAERLRDGPGSPAVRLYQYLFEDVGTVCRLPYNLGGATTSAILLELDFAVARARSERLFDARVTIIEQGVEAGEFVTRDSESAGRAIEWTIEGLLTDLAGGGVDDPDATATGIADFCVRALLSDPGRLGEIRDEAMAASGRG